MSVPIPIITAYVSDVPLQAPNPQYPEKLYFNRFGPSEKVCYKYAIKVVFKLCLNDLGKIWDHLHTISVPVAGGRRPHFGRGGRRPPAICQKMCLNRV